MHQASCLHGVILDAFSIADDRLVSVKVDIDRREIGEALVIAMVLVALDGWSTWPSKSPGRW